MYSWNMLRQCCITTDRAEVKNKPIGYTDILWPATNLALYLEPTLQEFFKCLRKRGDLHV